MGTRLEDIGAVCFVRLREGHRDNEDSYGADRNYAQVMEGTRDVLQSLALLRYHVFLPTPLMQPL